MFGYAAWEGSPTRHPHSRTYLKVTTGISTGPPVGCTQFRTREHQRNQVPITTEVATAEPIDRVGLGVHPVEPWACIDLCNRRPCKSHNNWCPNPATVCSINQGGGSPTSAKGGYAVGHRRPLSTPRSGRIRSLQQQSCSSASTSARGCIANRPSGASCGYADSLLSMFGGKMHM